MPTTIGEHIRKLRLERNQAQGYVSKLLNINQMYLSSWELNQKAPHPKHLKSIINYLGYVPTITSNIEKLGMRTKLYRIKHNLSLDEFCHMGNIEVNIVMKLETMRFCKLPKEVIKTVKKALKLEPISCSSYVSIEQSSC